MTTGYVSPQITSSSGSRPRSTSPTATVAKQLHPDDRDRAIDDLEGGIVRRAVHVRVPLIARDGRVVWFSDSAIVIRDPAGVPLFVHGVMLDITERKAAEEQLAYLAYHDKLTGLPNRAMFDELSELAIARARRQRHAAWRCCTSTWTTSSS